jgi:hypothetical protein
LSISGRGRGGGGSRRAPGSAAANAAITSSRGPSGVGCSGVPLMIVIS